MTEVIAELHQKLDRILDDPHRKRWLSVADAALYMGVSEESVRRLVAAGKLSAHRPVKGRVILDRLQCDTLVQSSTATPRRGRGRRS